MPALDTSAWVTKWESRSAWAVGPVFVLCASGVLLFALRDLGWTRLVGYGMVVVALLAALLLDRAGRTRDLFRDMLLIAIGMLIVSVVSVKADISWGNFLVVGLTLGLAVLVPYLIARFVYRDRRIRLPWAGAWPWSKLQWLYLVLILVAGWLILPFYFVTSGVYLNWPEVHTWDEVLRLFIGVNAVGTWDELFFIITVFALLRRHLPPWPANLLQAIVFVSFLWELGYQAWGPAITIPFALIQGLTFTITRSIAFVLTVHLLFDLVVFLVIVHARNPGWFDFFLV